MKIAVARRVLTLVSLMLMSSLVFCQKQYDMDKFSTCGSTVNVDDDGVRLRARGAVSPSNPPTQCIVYLRSIYTRDDGTNKLQVEVEAPTEFRDSAITVDIFNGRRSSGRYLKRLSYRDGSINIIYSQANSITVLLRRPNVLYQPDYRVSLLIKPWKDRDVIPPSDGKETLSTGAIIGIVFGGLILVALVILFCWCCCTGRVSGFRRKLPYSKDSRGLVKNQNSSHGPGVDNRVVVSEKGKPGVINMNDPVVWNSVVSRNDENQRNEPRYYERSNPRYYNRNDSRYYDRSDSQPNYRNGERNGDYEPYDYEKQQGRGRYYRRNENGRGYNQQPQQNAGSNENLENQPRQPAKETMIDDVFESDSAKDDDVTNTDIDDATLQKRPLGGRDESPKLKREEELIPEERDLQGSPHLERYKSMDLQSQPDLDTITSPLHVNAGIMASVEDDDVSPTNSLRKKKKGERSPRPKRAGEREPDPLAMPPEAFEPIFSGAVQGINYPSPRDEPPPAYPGGLMPYGLIPAMHFAPTAPGAQTYAYAYQTAPTGGPPATQGAYVVQNIPTSDGNRRTAFAVEHTLSPDKSNIPASPKDRRRKNSDPFHRNENRLSGGSKRSRGKDRDRDHDLAVIARGAAPPDPGPGHRSMAMKSGTNPDSGIQTTQVVWTDTLPDPTDPDPGANPQITRKTITRVTTKSGHTDLPPEPALLGFDDEEPAFLSPSKPTASISPSHPNAAIKYTPDRNNVAFYTGAGSTEVPPERSSTPNSMHHPTSYNRAIRDRIPLDDSTV